MRNDFDGVMLPESYPTQWEYRSGEPWLVTIVYPDRTFGHVYRDLLLTSAMAPHAPDSYWVRISPPGEAWGFWVSRTWLQGFLTASYGVITREAELAQLAAQASQEADLLVPAVHA
jgi:hypothetical protein